MERAVEWFIAVTSLAIGASHFLRPGDWTRAYQFLHRCGRAGAFANGAIAIVPGMVIVIGHNMWAWPWVVLTVLGWLLIAKGMLCFLAPDKALRSMEWGSRTPSGFVAAGVVLLAIGAWSCYCLWLGVPNA